MTGVVLTEALGAVAGVLESSDMVAGDCDSGDMEGGVEEFDEVVEEDV